MMRAARFVGLCVLLNTVLSASQQTPPKGEKVDIVSVTGCLKEAPPNTWALTNATDPVVSNANAPSPKELASAPRSGKNEFRLIGVSEFNLPAHRDHLVLIKGLHIKASPTSRLNVTSLTMVAASCEQAPKMHELGESQPFGFRQVRPGPGDHRARPGMWQAAPGTFDLR